MRFIISTTYRVYPVPGFQQYPCSHIAARLKGEFCHIARICASCSLRQIVHVVLSGSSAVKDSSAAFAFDGYGVQRAVLLQIERC